jgi:hypothetical protein
MMLIQGGLGNGVDPVKEWCVENEFQDTALVIYAGVSKPANNRDP